MSDVQGQIASMLAALGKTPPASEGDVMSNVPEEKVEEPVQDSNVQEEEVKADDDEEQVRRQRLVLDRRQAAFARQSIRTRSVRSN